MERPRRTSSFLAPSPGRGEIARSRLLDAAVRVFGEKGLRGATVRDIAAEAGQNVAAIAYYFGGKEDLYTAVIAGIACQLQHEMHDVIATIRSETGKGPVKPARAIELLQLFFRAVYIRLLSRPEVVAIARIMVREQTEPTAAFNVLYDQVIREVHEILSALVAAALEADPRDETTIIRTHSLMGQVWFFAIARETILRRLGWHELAGKNAERVTRVLDEQVLTLLKGLRARRGARRARL